MIKVVELFAGVGGFRVGLEKASEEFVTVYANQWEPNKKKQYAYENYCSHWINHNCTNIDITQVDKNTLPDFDLLVGGNPCQNWSIGSSTKYAKGLEGNKGILWYQIYDTLKVKRPKYFLIENVDRQLKAPSNCRGRDFATMLYYYRQLGYSVEWRIIDSSKYGSPQRRKRVYVFGCLESHNILNKVFPVNDFTAEDFSLPDNTETLKTFSYNFGNYGYIDGKKCVTAKVIEKEESKVTIRDILDNGSKRYLTKEQINKFKYLKGSKKIQRKTKEGYEYIYSEGAIPFPDDLDSSSRTILTSEGSINRCTHIIDDNGLRFFSPIECERLNGFPDNWTNTMPNRMRYFCMGNALVVPIVTRIGKEIINLER